MPNPESNPLVVEDPVELPTPAVVDPVEAAYLKLEDAVRANRPGDDLSTLRKAYEFSRERHGQQKRKSGEAYIFHPLAVAQILAGMQMDLVSMETGLLHDLVEDTPTTVDELGRLFGKEVAHCVDGVTKLEKLNLYSREDRQAENVRKMLLAMVSGVHVGVGKLA